MDVAESKEKDKMKRTRMECRKVFLFGPDGMATTEFAGGMALIEPPELGRKVLEKTAFI